MELDGNQSLPASTLREAGATEPAEATCPFSCTDCHPGCAAHYTQLGLPRGFDLGPYQTPCLIVVLRGHPGRDTIEGDVETQDEE